MVHGKRHYLKFVLHVILNFNLEALLLLLIISL